MSGKKRFESGAQKRKAQKERQRRDQELFTSTASSTRGEPSAQSSSASTSCELSFATGAPGASDTTGEAASGDEEELVGSNSDEEEPLLEEASPHFIADLNQRWRRRGDKANLRV